MKVFFLDLWMDLREKRLAPVAILLLAGIVAVAVLLPKDSEPAPAPPPTATTAAAPAGPVVQSETETLKNSRLTVFSPRDPFEPTGSTSTSTGTSTGTTSGTSTSTSTSTTTTGTPTTGTGTTGGGTTTGSQPTTGTGNTGNTTPQTTTTLFTYTTDLKFGESGDVKTYKNVRRLELVPSEKDPKIVFLGVTATAKTAVFLVDSNLGVDTDEGRCRPSADECTFLYLRPDSDHDQATLTDSDGTVFHVRLININRVTVSSSNGNTNSNGNGNGNGNSNSNRSPAFTGSADDKRSGDDSTVPGETPPGEPSRPFTYPGFFADTADAPEK